MAHGGNDYLFGGSGGDDMYGGLGNDVYEVEDMRDHVIENFGEGTDTVWAYRTYTLTANVENLVLYTTWGYGNDLNNRITGDQYFNEMEGRGGDDYLDGGGSADRMIGGTGNDTYVVETYPDKRQPR